MTTEEYFVSFGSIASGIRVRGSISSDNFTLFSHRNRHNPLNDNIVQSLIIKVIASNTDEAYAIASKEKNQITAYLAGIFQVPFFFTDHSVDYELYDKNPVEEWNLLKLPPTLPIVTGWPRSYGIMFTNKNSVVIDEIPDFAMYKQYEKIFYMWRSATDPFNELGWRFLNYFRIIEIITKKQRGGKNKSKSMYREFSAVVKKIIPEEDFAKIAEGWGNPSAHGNMPNSIVPITTHGNYEEHADAVKLTTVVGLLIGEFIKYSKNLPPTPPQTPD